MRTRIRDTYENVVLRRPVATLVALTTIILALSWFARDFALDASADSLVLERDEDLDYYRYIRARYGSDDYLIVTYTPATDLFDSRTLRDLTTLRDELGQLRNVESVTSILDVPLVMSPPVDLRRISSQVRYLEDPDTDRKLARAELMASPLYRNLLIGSDGTTTAMRVDMRQDERYLSLRTRRDDLREKRVSDVLSTEEQAELAEVSAAFDAHVRRLLEQRERDITAVRRILDGHRDNASLHLGGVPMIVADSMDFIRNDLIVFGSAVSIFLVTILALVFRRKRWVLLPLLTCAAACVFMLGLLGRLSWYVTVVSSNFVALLLILCLALTVHIIVRYRELHEQLPEADQFTLVSETVRRIVVPCLYTALTTIVAFGSLLVSGIRPVIDFGRMMSIGIVVAFVLSFTMFPAALMLLQPGKPASRNDWIARITGFFARIIERHGRATVVVTSLLLLIGISGTSLLTVENRFIDYYRETTEIFRGMELIDRELGGTTPLEVIIDAPQLTEADVAPDNDEEEFEDIYADDTDASAGVTSSSYWFNSSRLPDVIEIHDYLDELPETGKVLSLATIATLLEQLEPGVLGDNFDLSIIYERLQPEVRATMFSPYLSDDGDQLRVSIRVFESDPTLRRAALLQKIRSDLVDRFGLEPGQIRLTGMLVLYNNMLQSLFRSQILTLAAVFVAIMLMFLVLFRSLRTAVVAIVPTLSSAILVLGLMGWFGIPLDLMTITIAAITVGIGVDDTIHYVHRFRREFAADGNYWAAVRRCHRSIGRAIYYTSVTIMLGFSVLAFSRFIPTIYFGVLTSLAMLLALLANMTLLPLLIVTFRAAGPARQTLTAIREST